MSNPHAPKQTSDGRRSDADRVERLVAGPCVPRLGNSGPDYFSVTDRSPVPWRAKSLAARGNSSVNQRWPRQTVTVRVPLAWVWAPWRYSPSSSLDASRKPRKPHNAHSRSIVTVLRIPRLISDGQLWW